MIARGPHPILFALMTLPAGIAQGFLTVTLPFIARKAGISVSAISSIIAIGLMPLILNFVWSSLLDLTLTYKRWCSIGACSCAGMLVLITAVPFRPATANLVTLASFIMMTGSTLIAIPLGALIAHAVPDELKGRSNRSDWIGRRCRCVAGRALLQSYHRGICAWFTKLSVFGRGLPTTGNTPFHEW